MWYAGSKLKLIDPQGSWMAQQHKVGDTATLLHDVNPKKGYIGIIRFTWDDTGEQDSVYKERFALAHVTPEDPHAETDY
jgi:hypothetical protein